VNRRKEEGYLLSPTRRSVARVQLADVVRARFNLAQARGGIGRGVHENLPGRGIRRGAQLVGIVSQAADVLVDDAALELGHRLFQRRDVGAIG
jgi:hypothetical protein